MNINTIKANPQEHNLEGSQVNKIRQDKQAIYSIPMFDLSLWRTEAVKDLEMLGILCVDTSTSLENTLWLREDNVCVEDLQLWADILALILK